VSSLSLHGPASRLANSFSSLRDIRSFFSLGPFGSKQSLYSIRLDRVKKNVLRCLNKIF